MSDANESKQAHWDKVSKKAGSEYGRDFMEEDFEAGRASVKPTHYAVIGSDGEMFLSYSLDLYPDAEKLCELEVEQMRLEVSGADDWTVKGVTVHD